MRGLLTITQAARHYGLLRSDIRWLIRKNMVAGVANHCGRFWTTRRSPVVCVRHADLRSFLNSSREPFALRRMRGGGIVPLPSRFPMTHVRWG